MKMVADESDRVIERSISCVVITDHPITLRSLILSRLSKSPCRILLLIDESELPMLKHNTYFDGHVQSVGFERNGLKATVGVIAQGEYHFGTAAAERMTVVSGQLAAKLPGAAEWQSFPAGTYFEVPANSGFDVRALGGAAAYLCEFLA